jgi:hypothetical protein
MGKIPITYFTITEQNEISRLKDFYETCEKRTIEKVRNRAN